MILQELITKMGFSVDEKPLHKLEHTLEGMHQKLEFLAAAEIVRGVWELAERFAGMGESLETAAVSAGITASEFQKLAFAASQNAVGQEELSGALAKMTRLLQKAKDGSQGAIDSFGKLGITPEQVAGFRNSEDALYAVQDAVKGIEDPILRVAAVTAIFGRGAAHMVKFIGKGADETKRLGAEAQGMGAVLSDQGVESLANFEDAVSGLGQVVRTFGARIGATFAPVFVAVIHDVEKLWGANQKLIATNLKRWAGDAAYAFGFITEVLRVVTIAFLDFVNAHPELVSNTIKVIGALMALSLGVGAVKFLLGGTVETYKTLTGVASMARPILGAAFSLGRVGARLFFTMLGSLAGRLGLMLTTLFPGLSSALAGIGTILQVIALNPFVLAFAGTVAALGVAYVTLSSIWDMLHGKSFWDTWLGEGLAFILKWGGKGIDIVKNLFGYNTKEGRDNNGEPLRPFAEDAPEFMRRAEGHDQDESWYHNLPSKFLEQMGKLGGGGTSSLQALNATAMPMAMDGGPAMPSSVGAAGDHSVNINAPITINAPGGDAKQIAHEAHKAVTTVLNQHFRETDRDHTPAAHH